LKIKTPTQQQQPGTVMRGKASSHATLQMGALVAFGYYLPLDTTHATTWVRLLM